MSEIATEIVVEGRTAGTSSLILWDQSGRSQMLDVIVDLDVTGLRTAITRAYPKGEVEVQADGGRLVLTGNVPDAKSIEDLTKMATVYSPQVVSSLQVSALHELYTLSDPGCTSRVTVPVLFDTVERTIVSNESADILRMFNRFLLRLSDTRCSRVLPFSTCSSWTAVSSSNKGPPAPCSPPPRKSVPRDFCASFCLD